MSYCYIGKNIENASGFNNKTTMFGKGKAARIALLASFFAAISILPSEAALFGSNKSSKKTNNIANESVQLRIDNRYENRNITGSNLDSYNFAQTHFGQSKAKLEQICRAVSSRYNEASARDILQKIFVIDTQLYKENIKNSALSIGELLKTSNSIGQGLVDLRQIVMSPGQQTLETLDKTIDQVRAVNSSQLLCSQKYLVAMESIINMAQASYETYELIPSLAINELDMFVQASKQLMTNIRSHGESFKGLVLNIKSSSEQIESGLSGIKQTIKETLRFSDHFAIKQFPLINLPAPSREKIYVQINSLANTVKGVNNTISIGDSQVRNSAQQFSHLVASYVDKSAESMKYNKPDFGEKAVNQISNYARNQICGLFARIKEDVGNMRTEMAKAGKANGNLQPIVNMETRSEYAARKAKSAAEEKLPLFLLGGKGGNSIAAASDKKKESRENKVSDSLSDFGAPKGFMALNNKKSSKSESSYSFASDSDDISLFSDNDFASASKGDDKFMTSEMNILQQELGDDFFFGDSGDNISQSSLMAQGDEDLPSYGLDNESFSSEDSAQMQVSYSNLENDGEPEVEMMRFDSTSLDETDEEHIPMMKYDSDVLNFDELEENEE